MKETAYGKTPGGHGIIVVFGVTVLAFLMLLNVAGAAPFAYVSNYNDDTVSVIDTATDTVKANVTVGDGPFGIAVSPDESQVYVANQLSDNVSVINAFTNNVTATVSVGINPVGVAITPDGSKVYVTNYNSSTTSVIDTATNTITATVPVESSPYGVAVNPNGTKVYVVNAASSNVFVIGTATNVVISTVPVVGTPDGIEVTPDGTKIYVTSKESNTVSVIDAATDTVTATVPVGFQPTGVAVTPDGSKVYVTNYNSNTTSIIDTSTNSVIGTVPVGSLPYGVAVTPNGTKVYVANYGDNDVSVIDSATNNVTATVPVGTSPFAFGKFIGAGENLTVHFLDVGQGDSVLIEYNNKSMLIDAGESDQGEIVLDYLRDQGISTLNYVVTTHPHSDHIGGINDVINNFKIEHFIDSGYPYASKTYENMLIAIDKKNIPFETPKRGNKISFAPGIDVEVLNPGTAYYSDDINQNSVVLKVTDGNVSFLLMGDAGIEAENDIMKAGYNVNSDILKVGHHGSKTASGASFISAVSPEISIIEVGTGNNYGHPHTETLERLEKVSKVYRTDLNGTVIITTDGSTYSVTTQKTELRKGTNYVSSGNVAYGSINSTTTQGTKPIGSITSSSEESTVYVSDLNLKDEWVKVTNKGSSSVLLTGWKIEDYGSKHTYLFPSYTLDSGSTVTVYTGKGTGTATELYWGSDSQIWNNDGDTASLYDSSGKLVSTLKKE